MWTRCTQSTPRLGGGSDSGGAVGVGGVGGCRGVLLRR